MHVFGVHNSYANTMHKLICLSLLVVSLAIANASENVVEKFEIINKCLSKPATLTGMDNYHLGKTQQSYDDAKKYCNSSGWKLLTIPNIETQFDLINFLRYYQITEFDFWTDGNKLDGEKWRWDEQDSELSYKNWASGQPRDDNNALCLLTNKSSMTWWNDNCKTLHHFICQKN